MAESRGKRLLGEVHSRSRAGTVRAGRAVAHGGRAAWSGAQRFTRAEGAGESGLARVLELHALSAAGDAAIAVSLAGTLFFTVPTEQASGQVALFLAVTMLPFALVAPLIGPFIDRFRHGRRWAIGSTLAIRGFCCWVLADAVADESPGFYVAALLCLVSSKAYSITRAAAVPRVLPEALTLVKANARISLTGTFAAALSAPLAIGFATIGPAWSLRYAFVLFVAGTVVAILLPAQVDSSTGEVPAALGTGGGVPIPRSVVDGLRCNVGLRTMSGFLAIYMAFILREPPAALAWPGPAALLMALVIGAAGLGNVLGVALGTWARSRNPRRVVVAALFLDAGMLAVAALIGWWPAAAALGLVAGFAQSVGKLSLDALIQRDVAEEVRTSMFARSEALLQLAWVLGGLCGIGLFTLESPMRLSLGSLAAALIAWAVFVLARILRRRSNAQRSRSALQF
ncbi:MAG TPA: MFS transporter [Aeromicrobium sp.]|nr:MFS transporter [Aeromicrobium sp.]HKY58246.1 MFS transporter [Aeromicrobium sp.]